MDIQLQQELDAGGMGRVFKARATLPYGREFDVAVKLIHPDALDRKGRARFIREVETTLLGNHRHPNLVTTFWAGVTEHKTPYLIMELVDASLHKVALHGALDPPIIRRIMRDVLRALSHMHRRHVLHCDLSPGNIMMSRDGRVLLGDFGLVQRRSGRHWRKVIGTPEYVSPEVYRGCKHTRASDVFGLGAVLYDLVTGEPVYGEREPTRIYGRIISEQPPAPLLDSMALADDIRELIRAMVCRDPDERLTVDAALERIEAGSEEIADDAALVALIEARIPRPPEQPESGLSIEAAAIRAEARFHVGEELAAHGGVPELQARPKRWQWVPWAIAAVSFVLGALGMWGTWSTPRASPEAGPVVERVEEIAQPADEYRAACPADSPGLLAGAETHALEGLSPSVEHSGQPPSDAPSSPVKRSAKRSRVTTRAATTRSRSRKSENVTSLLHVATERTIPPVAGKADP